MPSFKVKIKWGKEKFDDVVCNTDEEPIVFKAQVFALSGVQPERQKIMVKGQTLKDDEWTPFSKHLKDGVQLLMMGTADALPEAPVQKTVFMEDMSEEQLASALELPPGLKNLGNTCYMNACIQCLRTVPELKTALKKYKGGLSMANPAQNVSTAMKDLFSTMESTSGAVPPIIFVQVLHQAFPRFSEKNDQGVFMQQDANECWTELVRCLQQQKLEIPLGEGDISVDNAEDEAKAIAMSKGLVDSFFGGMFDTTLKNVESEDEPKTEGKEEFLQLSCFIQQEVKYMHTGLRSKLEENITKFSATLNRDAEYLKTSRISRLPSYLAIQFVRFFYKEREGVNAKILKDVKFTLSLDVYDMCTPELQARLLPMRERFKAQEERDVEKMTKVKMGKNAKSATNGAAAASAPAAKENTRFSHSFPDDVGSNNSGFYELQAVLTHKGRSSSSGHYVGWVRQKGDEWLMCDDDEIRPVTSEDVLKLSGGGDWHTAYVLLYRSRVLEMDEEDIRMEKEAAEAAAKKNDAEGDAKMDETSST